MQRQAINLTFHGIGTTDRPLETDEDRVWISRVRFLDVLDSVVGRDDVRITFDDGNASDLEHALPALRERGLKATFFIVAGRLGVPGFLSEDDVRALAGSGMGIGCHGMRHRSWRRLDDRALREEVVDAKAALEAIVGSRVSQAACPFGAYDRRVLRTLAHSGYREVFTSDGGAATADGWLQPRNSVRRGDDAGLLARIAESERSPYRTLGRRTKRLAKRWR